MFGMGKHLDRSIAASTTFSSLALLQQALLLVAVGSVAWWAWHFWPAFGGWVLPAALGMLLSYVLVLALQFLAVACSHGDDPAPRAGAATLLKAWWREVRVAPSVFAWRQPFCWRAWPDGATRHATDDLVSPGRPALVFVHGYLCNRGFWQPWMRQLSAQGVRWTSVNLQPLFTSIDDYVSLIDEAVERARAWGGCSPVLVCHSMGGLAARAWLVSRFDAAQCVAGVVTIGSPHHGTWLGHLSQTPNGRQMRRDSDWLQALAVRERAQRPRDTYGLFTCWYSNADNIVFPASTATLPGADNRFVAGAPHVDLAFEPGIMAHALSIG